MSSDGVEWQALLSMADPNRTKFGFAVGGGGGGVAAVGGRTRRTGAPLNTVERYSVLDGQWRKMSHMLHERWMPGTTMWNGCLTAVGGENAEAAVSMVEICDEVVGVWEELHASPGVPPLLLQMGTF